MISARTQLQMANWLIDRAISLLSVKLHTKTRNNWNRYLKQISVGILLKQLYYSLSNSWFDWQTDWLTDWLTERPTGWLAGWVTDRVTDWLIDWLIPLQRAGPNKWRDCRKPRTILNDWCVMNNISLPVYTDEPCSVTVDGQTYTLAEFGEDSRKLS